LISWDLTVNGSTISTVCISFENLFKITPVGVMSKYVFTGACQTLIIMFLNNPMEIEKMNPIWAKPVNKAVIVTPQVSKSTKPNRFQWLCLVSEMSLIQLRR
jgi:hypothetical protein